MVLFYINPILISAAIIPAIILLVKVYRADRLEPEPPGLLISLILYGIIATGLAMASEWAGTLFLDTFFSPDSLVYQILLYFIVVGCSEEGFKYLLLKKRTWRSPAFNCQFDGVVYATFVSLGFALWENIGYVLRYGFGTALVRAVTAVPGHACFGVFMGAWYGLAKRYAGGRRDGASKACRIMAFLLPACIHGCYDFIASIESQQYGWLFVAFIAVMFVVAWILIKRISKYDWYMQNVPPFYR